MLTALALPGSQKPGPYPDEGEAISSAAAPADSSLTIAVQNRPGFGVLIAVQARVAEQRLDLLPPDPALLPLAARQPYWTSGAAIEMVQSPRPCQTVGSGGVSTPWITNGEPLSANAWVFLAVRADVWCAAFFASWCSVPRAGNRAAGADGICA